MLQGLLKGPRVPCDFVNGVVNQGWYEGNVPVAVLAHCRGVALHDLYRPIPTLNSSVGGWFSVVFPLKTAIPFVTVFSSFLFISAEFLILKSHVLWQDCPCCNSPGKGCSASFEQSQQSKLCPLPHFGMPVAGAAFTNNGFQTSCSQLCHWAAPHG